MNIKAFGDFISIITILAIIILGNIFGFKELFIVGILGIIPISFFIEGIICSRKNIEWIIP